MAKQRYINTHFWNDGFVSELEPTEKLLFLYLLTNPSTTIAGAYEISIRKMAFDTGIDRSEIQRTLEMFGKARKITYTKSGWIILHNFIKHQSLNPKIISGIRREIATVPDEVRQLINFEYEPSVKPKRSKISKTLRESIFLRDGYKCLFCGSTEGLEIDHIKPVSVGGDNAADNLRTLCGPCNGKRNSGLRWDKKGDIFFSENSLPIEIGGLSHLNTNTNTNINSIVTESELEDPPTAATSEPKQVKMILPPDWKPSTELLAWTMATAPGLNVSETLDDFLDFWRDIATRDNKRTLRGWDATWRKRIKTLKQNGYGSNRQITTTNRASNADRLNEYHEVLSEYPSEAELGNIA